MKIRTFIIIFFILIIKSVDLFSCFAVIAGRLASYDGSVLIAHCEQNGPPAFLNFIKVPEYQYSRTDVVKFRNGIIYPLPEKTYSYLWSENFGMKGSDAVMNEYGVICVSNATRTKEDAPEELSGRGEIIDGGVTLEIRLEIAKRAKTARQALYIAKSLIEKYGYNGGGGTHVIADANEAWLLTVVGGKHWIAARVPDDKVVVLPNVNVIREINLNDTVNFLASKDIIDYAIKRSWYIKGKGNAFDFKKAYDKKPDNLFASKNGCDARQWRGQCLVTGKTIEIPVKDDGLPFAVIPFHKLTITDMRNIISDHLEGTEFDLSNKKEHSEFIIHNSQFICNPPKNISQPALYKGYSYANGSPHKLMQTIEGMICNRDLQEGAIFQLRSWLPAAIGCIYWRTTAAPCSSVLTPWYLGISSTPAAYHKDYDIKANTAYDFHFNPPAGTYSYDGTKAFWLYNSIENMVDQDYGKYIGKIRNICESFEQQEIADSDKTDKQAFDLYKKDKNLASDFLTKYCNEKAMEALENAKQLDNELKTEILGY